MKTLCPVLVSLACLFTVTELLAEDAKLPPMPAFDRAAYEAKPDDPEFEKFFPAKAPAIGNMLLEKGDRLVIIGDSITEQKMYSRMIETYLTACMPHLEVKTRQLGWSGETAAGFLRRMDSDCLRFEPTIATLCYGMNDARYRPFDVTNGRWYQSHYQHIVKRLKEANAKVVLGSPGCAGKIATWVKAPKCTLDEHNLNLCSLRDLAIEIAEEENVAFADLFWPMYVAQIQAAKKYGTKEKPYQVTGNDGIHPPWAGQVIMAHGFLTAMGIKEPIADLKINWTDGTASGDEHHQVTKKEGSVDGREVTYMSSRYPFCAAGPTDNENSIRSGMTLVPFNETLNQFLLTVDSVPSAKMEIRWGDQAHVFTKDDLEKGVNLAEHFQVNPFSDAFKQIDQAVAEKQAYETVQIKKIFHGKEGKQDLDAAVKRTEAERDVLVQKIQDCIVPVSHTLVLTPLN
ncbi:SGNH/GDSL hydrolase family protein [Rhodopirellula sp. JC740]|uniref:SGNH/GDSL hydrolase family protein n=1 Tax=Rhodopirellula halodulae TaxID=2894198 RepID=A0ABS8NDD0_9BACT|nr:SGNH/GDSL hydrolase family protein [Rhodopirellula sp. JC740]MCC9641549.1 SGNH/GDSL hydrolase family protein [Rhodopirellula sp. JC740]